MINDDNESNNKCHLLTHNEINSIYLFVFSARLFSLAHVVVAVVVIYILVLVLQLFVVGSPFLFSLRFFLCCPFYSFHLTIVVVVIILLHDLGIAESVCEREREPANKWAHVKRTSSCSSHRSSAITNTHQFQLHIILMNLLVTFFYSEFWHTHLHAQREREWARMNTDWQ